MAEIDDTPNPNVNYQSSGSLFIGTAIVTALAGLWSAINGFFVFLIGNYSPVFRIGMGFMMVGIGMILLGVFAISVGYNVFRHKTNSRGFGVISNIGIIVLNVFFFLAIGILGLVLCIISIIGLSMLGNN